MKIAELEAKFLNVDNEFKNLKHDVNENINHVEYTLRQGINNTWEYAVWNEQYSHKSSLMVLGLKEEEEENLEDKFIDAIANNLDMTVDKQEIEIIYQIGHRLNWNSNQTSSNRKPRPVIVKFVSNKTKTRILTKQHQIKGKPLLILEDMASDLAKYLKELKSKESIESAWFSNGKIK